MECDMMGGHVMGDAMEVNGEGHVMGSRDWGWGGSCELGQSRDQGWSHDGRRRCNGK